MAKLEQYLLQHIDDRSESIVQLETYAKDNRVPIMDPVSVNFLMQLIKIKKPKHILEIGTAIGYSALRMNEAYPDAKITTIERNDHMFNVATENIKKFNKEQHINVIHGDAITVLDELVDSEAKQVYDLIFIDAAKAQYKRFFELAEPLLSNDGIIVSDNVLFKGLVIEQTDDNDRLNKLASKIGDYNTWLSNLENYTTSIVPIGDGIAISLRI